MEGESLRGTVIRIDDSNYLRRFVRIFNGGMIDFSTFCMLKNAIRVQMFSRHYFIGIYAKVGSGEASDVSIRGDSSVVST